MSVKVVRGVHIPAYGYGEDPLLCIRVPLNLLLSSGEKFNKCFLDHAISIKQHIFWLYRLRNKKFELVSFYSFTFYLYVLYPVYLYIDSVYSVLLGKMHSTLSTFFSKNLCFFPSECIKT